MYNEAEAEKPSNRELPMQRREESRTSFCSKKWSKKVFNTKACADIESAKLQR